MLKSTTQDKNRRARVSLTFTTLKLNLETLKELGPQFMGPKNIKVSKLIGDVIDDAQKVVNQGPHANSFEVNKSLSSVKKLLRYLKQKKIRQKQHIQALVALGWGVIFAQR